MSIAEDISVLSVEVLGAAPELPWADTPDVNASKVEPVQSWSVISFQRFVTFPPVFGCVGCFSCYALAAMCANDARARVTLHIFAPDGLVDRPLVLSHAMQALVH